MNVVYTDAAKEAGDQYVLLQQATKRLEEILGQYASQITARWDRTEDDKGRTLYLLQLEDFTGEVAARFAPDDLRSPTQTAFRLRRMWIDLLQLSNELQLEKLTGKGGRSES